MGVKIYVGGLPYSTSESELNDLFTTHGTVESAKVITDRDSRGVLALWKCPRVKKPTPPLGR